MDLHPLIDEILTTGKAELPDGTLVAADSYIVRAECELVYRAVAAAEAHAAVEIGMAYGVSSLCIADALVRTARGDPSPSPCLTSIDPHQTTQWHRAGLHLVQRAGLGQFLKLIEQPSQIALPRLVEAGERLRFALIDGWHTFDHTLVDFFFVDLLLEPGGIVVFDDVGYPAVAAVVRFVLANRNYEVFEALPIDVRASGSLPARRAVKRMLRPLARTDRDPSPASEQRFREVENAFAVALRKSSDDARRFDHFERF